MFKRTNGYILLVLLVITGLGSQVSNDTLSTKERRFLVHHLKETRNQLQHSIKGLTEAQLNFRPAPDQWSIREHVEHLQLTENFFYTRAMEAISSRHKAEDASVPQATDSQVLTTVTSQDLSLKDHRVLDPGHVKDLPLNATIHSFKDNRARTIKFVRTTTDNIRLHTTTTPFGRADAYQILLAVPAYSEKCIRHIQEIRAHPQFPK